MAPSTSDAAPSPQTPPLHGALSAMTLGGCWSVGLWGMLAGRNLLPGWSVEGVGAGLPGGWRGYDVGV